MPGSGKYARGKYSGHLRPSWYVTAEDVQGWSKERLLEVWDALNDAYDFDMVDNVLMKNTDLVVAEMKRRGMWP